jgi:hypothetical protein
MTAEIKFRLPSDKSWREIDLETGTEGKGPDEEEAKKTETNKSNLNNYLLSSLQMQNIMVLAGSGTSLGNPGGPSMSDLWDVCTKESENEGYTEQAEGNFERVHYSLHNNGENIEDLLSNCEAVLQIYPEGEDIAQFLKFCKDNILRECGFETNDISLEAHKTFLHRLSRRRVRDPRVNLFTTNYDTCFETAAAKQGIVVIDGFSFTKPRYYDPCFFDYDIVRRKSSGEEHSNYLEGVIKLYKLHGSVNWARKDGKILEEKASGENACLIFPAKGKYQQSYIQPHLELMAKFLFALREPNTCLIICGFGFNDEHLSGPIISAISNNPHLKVIVVDINAEKKFDQFDNNQHLKELIDFSKKGEDICFINTSFQGFANLIPNLHSLTAADMLAKNIQNVCEGND